MKNFHQRLLIDECPNKKFRACLMNAELSQEGWKHVKRRALASQSLLSGER